MTTSAPPSVPVGVTTILGYLAGLVQVVLAAVCYVEGEHTAAYALLGTGNANGLLVLAGRYLQAHKLIPTTVVHQLPPVAPVAPVAPALTVVPTDAQEAADPPPPAA